MDTSLSKIIDITGARDTFDAVWWVHQNMLLLAKKRLAN